MSNDLFGVVALLVIVGIGAVAYAPAFASGSERVGAADTVTVDYTTPQQVDESGLAYADTVTVTSGGSELDADVDYRWNETAGEIAFQNTSATSSGDSVTVEYQYREAGERQRTVGRIVSLLSTPLAFLVLLLVGGYIVREVPG